MRPSNGVINRLDGFALDDRIILRCSASGTLFTEHGFQKRESIMEDRDRIAVQEALKEVCVS